MKRFIAPLVASLLLCSGCAQFMAARQPKNLHVENVLQPGVDRAVVIGTLGAPVTTDSAVEGRLTDVYKYVDGRSANSWGGKSARILLYTAGDVFTAFLSQIIWMPIEVALGGKDYSAAVDFQRGLQENRWTVRSWTETDTKGKVTKAGGTPATQVGSVEETTPPVSEGPADATGIRVATGVAGPPTPQENGTRRESERGRRKIVSRKNRARTAW